MRFLTAMVLILSSNVALAEGEAKPEDPSPFELGVRNDKGTDVVLQSKALDAWIPKEALAEAGATIVRADGKEESVPAKPGSPCKLEGLKPGDAIRFHAGAFALEARMSWPQRGSGRSASRNRPWARPRRSGSS